MVQSVCDTGAQADTWCPSTTDEVLPSVLGLLPHGPAWEASQVKGTVMNMFWRSVAAALAYLHLRLCAYVPEFFCATVVESRDQWNAEYGIGIDSCDPYGYSLCAKETTLGTSTCAGFVALALASGWAITCSTGNGDDHIAGCFSVGCSSLTLPEPYADGSNLGWGSMPGDCASIAVAGSNLGWTSMGCADGSTFAQRPMFDPGTCTVAELAAMTVAGTNSVIAFPCASGANDLILCPATNGCAGSQGFRANGDEFIWNVTVNMPASFLLQGIAYAAPVQPFINNVGNIVVGCTPIDTPPTSAFALCFLETIKPAQTTIHYTVVQP